MYQHQEFELFCKGYGTTGTASEVRTSANDLVSWSPLLEALMAGHTHERHTGTYLFQSLSRVKDNMYQDGTLTLYKHNKQVVAVLDFTKLNWRDCTLMRPNFIGWNKFINTSFQSYPWVPRILLFNLQFIGYQNDKQKRSASNKYVVGISLELPSGGWSEENLDHNSFFQFLLDKAESYTKIPVERFNIDTWHGKGIGQINVDQGSFLKNIDLFDNIEFGVSAKDAKMMAPSTRKLLEHSFLALLDSGIDYRSRNIGCFTAGVSYDFMHISGADEFDAEGSFSGSPAMIANRVSYHLDLLGPSVPLDTACSSSGTALHLAVTSLLSGDCEAAIVGGCQLNHSFIDWFNYSQGGLLAPDGKCKPFDASANGFSRGEGVVAIVIKPLLSAVRDGDHIYATILGTAANTGGSEAPPSAPVAEAQYNAMKIAFSRADISPRQVDYVECHATGTAKGDPTEVNWIGENFCREDPLLIGSVKGNIGHTEITAFLASLSKVLSMFHHQIIPPHINLEEPNPAIRWGAYDLIVPLDPTPLPSRGENTLVAMSSSGIGGANAHVVLESYAQCIPNHGPTMRQFFLLSAGGLSPRSAETVAKSIVSISSTLDQNALSILEAKLARQTRQMTWRTFIIVNSSTDATSRSESHPEFPPPSLCPRSKPPIIFVFSGQGPQYRSMGRELFRFFPRFKDTIIECDAIYQDRTGQSLLNDFKLFHPEGPFPEFDAWPIELTLPALTIFQIALFDLLCDFGVKPDVVVGHSAGETAVLYASGASSKAMAVELSIARGQGLSSISTLGGGMAALSCDSKEAVLLLREVNNSQDSSGYSVEIACYNSQSAVAIAGPRDRIARVLELAKAKGIRGQIINTRVPMHSSMIESCRLAYSQYVENVFNRFPGLHLPSIPTYSTLSGDKFNGPYNSNYFWDNSLAPVRFAQSVNNIMRTAPNGVFLEISPHPILGQYLMDITRTATHVFPCATRPRRGQPPTEVKTFLHTLGHLTLSGYNSITFKSPHHRIETPNYPFMKKLFPLYPVATAYKKQISTRNGPLNHPYLKINDKTHPSLAQHVIRKEPIMPAAGFIEMGFEFGATALIDVNLRSILSLSSDKPIGVDVQLDGCRWSVVSRRPIIGFGTDLRSELRERLHCDGLLSFEPPKEPLAPLDISGIRSRCRPQNLNLFYSSMSYAFQYGPLYQRVMEIYCGLDEALVCVKGYTNDLREVEQGYILQPAILDACFHVAQFRPFTGNFDPNIYYLPSQVGRVILHRRPQLNYFPDIVFAHCTIFHWEPETITYNIHISDVQGSILCSLEELQVTRHRLRHVPEVTRRFDVSLRPSPMNSTAHGPEELPQNRKGDKLYQNFPVESTSAGPCDFSAGANSQSPISSGEGKSYVIAEHAESSFDLDSAIIFLYNAGAETELQRFLSGIEPSQPKNIWITVAEGRAGDEAQGLTRSLRKEFPAWTVRLVIFPHTFDSTTYSKFIGAIPYNTEAEEFVVSSAGNLLIPVMVEVESKQSSSIRVSNNIPPGYVRIQVLAHSTFANTFSFVGQQCDISDIGPDPAFERKSVIMAGIAPLPVEDFIYVHPQSVYEVSGLPYNNAEINSMTFGSVVASLAPSLAVFEHPERLRSFHVLLTHSNTSVGIVVGNIYRACGVDLVEVHDVIGAVELSRLGHQSFDLVVSGFTDRAMQQIIHLLTKPRTGRTFFWDDMKTGILGIVTKQPWVIHDAIRATISGWQLGALPDFHQTPTDNTLDRKISDIPLFHDNKSYILIGGTGSLGPQIALWMYQRGVRHLILASRSGEAAFHPVSNVWSLRIIRYLRSRKDLTFTIMVLDATDDKSLRNFMPTISPALDGCFVLTTKNADGVFLNLSEQDFATVRRATCDVVESLERVVDFKELGFLVVMSSVSAVFGNGGQANYSMGKTVADGFTSKYKNAISFVCPPIAGTTLVSELQRSKWSPVSWEVSAEDMIMSLEDALVQLKNGTRFWYYIPDLDWVKLVQFIGPTKMCDYLLPPLLPTGGVMGSTMSKDAQVLDIVQRHIDVETDDLFDDVPLVSYGLDSLSASRLSFDLQRELGMEVSQIRLLANMTVHHLIGMAKSSVQEPENVELYKVFKSAMVDIRHLLAQYSGFPSMPPREASPDASPPLSTVLITGTTGSLGCHLLHQLIASTAVTNIIALNRISSQASLLRRQELALEKEGLPRQDACSSKVLLLDYDPSARNLGLSATVREKLLCSVTCILHNAWKTDFTAGLSSFEDLLMGTRGLILLALESKLSKVPLFTFVSTIGVSRFSSSLSAAIEQHIDLEYIESLQTVQLSDMSGYLQAKLVAEQMILRAQTDSALPANIIRVGQLSGGPAGTWDTSHWFPALVKSGLFVKCLPDGHDMVSWLPTHIAATAILEMSTQPNGVLHVVHPRPTLWNSLLRPIADVMAVPLVPYAEWYSRLSIVVDTNILSQFGENPAIKLLDFFRQGVSNHDSDISRSPTDCMGLLPKVLMERGMLMSGMLRDPELQQLGEADAKRWVAYWRMVGYLQA
ncbi:hypothetical protein BDZ94DRAFT_1294300 [Collybia nuda]|uniref:Polyketide synthase n=1 Tax=Collybia nuda TaxID=64659 RepID=A0A9P5YFC1_9AGAR|nr:hypothetical protein BDZ94DRAFT_1294300 [Collybia nuda]